MTGQRVAILDGSLSLFLTDPPAPDTEAPRSPTDHLGLQPIPHFKDVVLNTVREIVSSGETRTSKIAVVDVGVVCDTGAVGILGSALHKQVLNQIG
jgi:mediator of RNA polymerase II transcription subunit 14